MTNWKTLKITEKCANMENYYWILFKLDGFLQFKDGYYSHVDCINSYPCNAWKVGDYIKVDADKIRCYGSNHTFDDSSIIEKANPSSSINVITTRGSSSDIVISPSAVSAMNSPGAMDLARRMSEMVDATGKEYEFKIEQDNKISYSLICRKQK